MIRSKMGCSNGFNNNNNKSENINKWRNYFRKMNNNNSDIFEIIEQAIMVAALDCHKEFILHRVKIVELLFSCRLTNSCYGCGCDSDELSGSRVSHHHDDHDDGDGDRGGCGGVGSKESKVNSSCRDNDENDDDGDGDDHGVEDDLEIMNDVDVVNSESNNNSKEDVVGVSGSCEREYRILKNNKEEINFSYGDAEALTDEIEQEREIVGEVLRIKEILHNHQDESDSVLYESLRRLQLMALTVDILKETEIGKAVNAIRRHGSKQIRHLARSLIDGWKVIVDEWVKATQEIAEGRTPGSVNPSTVDEEEGLPSPPLDEGAFLATQDMELSQENFFDGIDDNGNPRNCVDLNKNRVVRRKPTVVNQDGPRRREECPKEATPVTRDNKVHQMPHQAPVTNPNRSSNMQSGPGRPLKVNDEMKAIKDNADHHRPMKPVIQRRPTSQAERLRSSNEVTVESKIEITKRKLQESYQQADLAKKSRTSKVMEIHDLPKQGVVNKNTQGRFGNYNRNWANGRR